jgi:hypothetical protein
MQYSTYTLFFSNYYLISFALFFRQFVLTDESYLSVLLEEERLNDFKSLQQENLIDHFFDALKIYLNHREDFWQIFLELLKIDMDESHPLKKVSNEILNKLIQR